MRAEDRNKRISGRKNGTDIDHALVMLPPRNVDIEKAVLGVILLEGAAFDLARDFLHPECFYEPNHKLIWQACETVYSKGYKIDLIIIADELGKMGELQNIGGAYSLMQLTIDVVSSAHLTQWCIILLEKYQLRETIRICQETISKSHREEDIFEILEEHEKDISIILHGNSTKPIKNTMDLIREVDSDLESLQKGEKKLLGLDTGFPQLNSLLYGLKPGNLILLGARPAVGKSAFAMNLALAISAANNVGIKIFSLEMPAKEYMYRMLSCVSGIAMERLMKGKIEPHEIETYQNAKDSLAKMKIFIDETPAINISQIRSVARRLVARGEIGLIIIDYLQLMGNVPGMRFGTRELEISYISKSLKELAKELNIPIIALSQLSRNLESRSVKKPMLSDLRESGSLEQDADIIIFMAKANVEGFIDFSVAKNRNGKIDEFELMVDFAIQKFFHRDSWNQFNTPKPVAEDPRLPF